jgi:nucleotide-binding universal stress UspA family protein
MEIRHLLVPTDFSEGLKQALAYAVGLARTCGAKLTLLHVVELPSWTSHARSLWVCRTIYPDSQVYRVLSLMPPVRHHDAVRHSLTAWDRGGPDDP